MKQAVHIFRKDLAHLWPQTTAVLLLVAAYAVLAAQSKPLSLFDPRRRLTDVLAVLVPAAYAWLIVTLVHQEALPGSRQFWLTRPYQVGSLLAAKALFIGVFASLSMIAKDCFIVAAHGLPIFPGVAGLLLRLAAWTAWVVLPSLAVGAITRNLQEAGLAGAAIALFYALVSFLMRDSGWIGIEWVPVYLGILVLIVACTAIVLWQYSRRRTAAARIAVACVAVVMIVGLPLLPFSAAFGVQMLVRRPAAGVAKMQIVPDPDLARPQPAFQGPGDPFVYIALPVRVSGVPADATIVVDGVRAAYWQEGRELGRSEWQLGWPIWPGTRFSSAVFALNGPMFRLFRDTPITVKVSLALTILQDRPPVSVPVHSRTFAYEGSSCRNWVQEGAYPRIKCRAAWRDLPRTAVVFEPRGRLDPNRFTVGTYSYAPYPATLDMSPIAEEDIPVGSAPSEGDWYRGNYYPRWEQPDARLVLTPEAPVAHFRRDLEFRGMRLREYAVATGGLAGIPAR